MNILKTILLLGKNFFFPSSCALCGGSFLSSGEIRYGLCEKCCSSIVPVKGERCQICGKPLISEIETCLPCRNKAPAQISYERLWTLFPYMGKYRKLLTSYKFGKRTALAHFFSEKLLEAIKEEPLLQDIAVVPVPPRPGKIKESGWDQVDLLVKQLEKKSRQSLRQIPICRCLKRRMSKVQKYLNRTERLENLKGRIFVQSSSAAAPERVFIIDDVITTGSTIEVCAQALKDAGAQKVYGLCLFYD